jgi:hypothetical protein
MTLSKVFLPQNSPLCVNSLKTTPIPNFVKVRIGFVHDSWSGDWIDGRGLYVRHLLFSLQGMSKKEF